MVTSRTTATDDSQEVFHPVTAQAEVEAAQVALAAAAQKLDEADEARSRSIESGEAAARKLAEAEEEAVQSMVAAAREGDNDKTRARIASAKQGLADARDAADWSRLEHAAKEVAFNEAVETAARAHRAVSMAEYVAEAKAYSDPKSREKVLLAQLTSTVAELLPLVVNRKRTHSRLAQEYQSCPVDERPELPEGTRIAPGAGTPGSWWWGGVQFFDIEIARAVQAGFDDGARTAGRLTQVTPRVP